MHTEPVFQGPGPSFTLASFLLEPYSKYFQSFLYHMYTVYLFSCDNFKDIVGVGCLFGALNASIANRFGMGEALTFTQILKASPSMALWSWSNLFLFNLHNQRHPHSIKEDALNKPWRPLPSGRLTSKQTTRAMYCMYPVVLGISLMMGGLAPCLLETVFSLWYNEWDGGADPFLKNFLTAFSMAGLFAGPLEVATGRSVFAGEGKAAIWLAIIAVGLTSSIHLQDFRDMKGDGAAGRKSVPLKIGDLNARLLCVLAMGFANSLACWFWPGAWMGSAIAWIAGIAIATNLFLDRSVNGDTFSWKLFPLWMLGLFLLPVLRE
ncbi:hypothetical protein F5X96DRAFT_646138 [Biscogniauxia mediterranea]|nr:hypothetical protein F5X96DRAFT_646138 [Biscogniauxia mediterranea]